MKEIKLAVNGKEYIKNRFTGRDWLRMLDYTEAAGNNPVSREFFDARYDVVSDMMNVPREELEKAELEEVTRIFKEIEREITAAFFGITPKEVEEVLETPRA